MDKINYALIGFGGIAENRIAKEGFACDKARFGELATARLVGATDINPQRQAAVEAMGLKWYDSVQAILEDPDIQAVFVATNNLTHVELAEAALNAGKHVLVEKPLATNATDAKHLVSLAQKKKLSLSVDHMMVHNALTRQARDFVADGTLGIVNDACFHMEFAFGYTSDQARTWRCSNQAEMGGPIGDVASHCFYVAEYILDSTITSIAATYYPKLMPTTVEDGAYIRFTLANGMTGSARAAFNEQRGGLLGTIANQGYEIYGDQAVLRTYGTMFQLSGYADEPFAPRMELDYFDHQKTIVIEHPENIYQGVILNHAESIIRNKPLNAQDGLRNVRLCEAAHESARNGGKLISIA